MTSEPVWRVLRNTEDLTDHLREISENLHRAELTVQERSDQIAEWSELIEQREKVRKVGAP